MASWLDSVAHFGAQPDIGATLAGAPTFVWSCDGAQALFANPAAGRMLGVAEFAALWRSRWPPSLPLRRMLESLGRSLPEGGAPARLRFPGDALGVARDCFCRALRGERQAGILVRVEGSAREPPTVAELAAFFSDCAYSASILDGSGSVLAGGPPDGAVGSTPLATICFDAAGAPLRLVIAARQAAEKATAQHGEAGDLAISGDRQRRFDRTMEEERLRRELERLALAPAERPTANVDIGEAPTPPPRTTPSQSARRAATKPPEVMLQRPAPPRAPEANARRVGKTAAGRVPRELSGNPVRFLWQTDASDRFLFVSPGLGQVVGRNAEVAGERWEELSQRLHLDPTRRIAGALSRRDTWSGLTAWWPVEGSNVRVPVELTALPIYSRDHAFQGYRGFGVLKPAEALMPAAFTARFGTVKDESAKPAEQFPPYEEAIATTPGNVVPIRAEIDGSPAQGQLTEHERSAFEEIAAALRSRVAAEPHFSAAPPASDESKTDLAPSPQAETGPAMSSSRSPRGSADGGSDAAKPRPASPPSTVAVEVRPPASQTTAADAQRRLREMAAILDTATDGVLVLDAAGVIESASQSAQALFGREEDELRGKPFADLLTPESGRAALDYLSGLTGSGVASLLNEGKEIEARAGDGAIPLFMTMGPISGQNGSRFCAVLRDITHWKRTEAELVAARRTAEAASSQKSDFLARVSHEIRTPLNAIIGFAEVMIEERFGAIQNERYREYLRDIRTSGEHVVSLISDLLDISKVEAGKLDLSFVAVPLNDLVRESIALMQPQANRAHVVLRSSLSRDVPGVVGDQRTLRQVILNLLSNSVKFTPPGGQVIASTSLAESGEALLRVRDTGAGMSEEELARALEPFRQLATASLADRTGTGLGLPLTKALVEANRASFAIRSARGEGTVVTVTFPATRVLSE